MKNWKQLKVMAIIAVFGIIIGFIACDNGKNDPVLCKCEKKDHLEAGQTCDCGGEDCNCTEEPKIQPDTAKILSFSHSNDGSIFAGMPCIVTVKSEEKFTTSEWNTFVDKVVTAIMRGYNKDMSHFRPDVPGFGNAANKSYFEGVFMYVENIPSSFQGTWYYMGNIVLLKSATYDCEVKANNYTSIYLKISSLDTVDIQPAVWIMAEAEPDSSYP